MDIHPNRYEPDGNCMKQDQELTEAVEDLGMRLAECDAATAVEKALAAYDDAEIEFDEFTKRIESAMNIKASITCDVPCGDSVVEENVKFLRDRSTVGQKKYGVTLDRDDLSPVEWVQHLREELADALNYATVVQRKMNDE